MPGSLPIQHEILQRPHHQHHKRDQVTTPLLQLLPDSKTDQRNGISPGLHQSTPTSHTTITSTSSSRSLVKMSKPVSRSVRPSMILITACNRAFTPSLIADPCPMDRKTDTKTSSFCNRSTKELE